MPGRAVWAGARFRLREIEPLLRGSIFDTPVLLFTVENGRVQPLAYDKDSLIAANIALPELTADTAFSGFRLRARFGDGGDVSNFALFQGASFFRLVAEGQDFGINARALALRPAVPRQRIPAVPGAVHRGARPRAADRRPRTGRIRIGDGRVQAHADSGREASVAGIDGTVFARAELDQIGLGGMQGSYLFGRSTARRSTTCAPPPSR